jgi:hypothetical protein
MTINTARQPKSIPKHFIAQKFLSKISLCSTIHLSDEKTLLSDCTQFKPIGRARGQQSVATIKPRLQR